MESKTEIRYWLRLPGSESGSEIEILKTMTYKVPEVGEVINFNTKIDREDLFNQHPHLDKEQLRKFLRKEDEEIKGDFVVESVKRWFEVRHTNQAPLNLPLGLVSDSTTKYYNRYPSEYSIESFEVYIQPFKHSELTETPIAKLRNLLGPMAGYFQMLELLEEMEENDEKKADLHKLLNQAAKQSSQTMDKILELVRNQKIWK